jgi:hypothetical protein
MDGQPARQDRADAKAGRDDRRPAESSSGPAQMTYALEVMRIGATFFVVLYHASLAYLAQPLRLTLWLAYDISGSRGFDVFVYWINGFVMPLFFLAAGVSAPAACQARGPREFLAHRARRLLRPLLFGAVMVLPFTYTLWGYGLIATGLCDEDQILSWRYRPEVRPYLYGLLHLWFLEYLFLACVLWAGAWAIAHWWNTSRRANRPSVSAPYAWLSSPWRPFIAALATAAIFLIDPDTMLRVDNTFVPNLPRLLHYTIFFVVGAWLSRIKEPKAQLTRWSGVYAVLSFVVYAAMAPLLLEHAGAPLAGGRRVAFVLLAAVFPWLTVFGALGLLLRYVKSRGATFRFLSEASFWIYIIHVPIVGLVQILLLSRGWPAVVKFIIVSTAAIALSLASYELLVRRSWIGEVINGARKRATKRSRFGPEFGWVATLALIVVALAAGAWVLRGFFFGDNFHTVVAGQVYRSGRLSGRSLEHAINARGIKTVVALTAEELPHLWTRQQQEVCASRGVAFRMLALPAFDAPSPSALAALVDVIDGCPRPLLVEGQRGVRNVSLASAVAQLLGGADPDAALREFALAYGEFTELDRSEQAFAILEYRDWLTETGQAHRAALFRTWASGHYVADRARRGVARAAIAGAAIDRGRLR